MAPPQKVSVAANTRGCRIREGTLELPGSGGQFAPFSALFYDTTYFRLDTDGESSLAAIPREALDAGPIFGTHLMALRDHLRSKLASVHDAEDLAQEVCLKFLAEWQRRDDIRNPRAYLLQIARNLLYVHYTRHAARMVETGVEMDALADAGRGLEAWAHDATRLDRISGAWQELSPKCQQVLRLRWREGLRVAEIANRMELSTAMVKKYLAQGLAHCRKRLGRAIEVEHQPGQAVLRSR